MCMSVVKFRCHWSTSSLLGWCSFRRAPGLAAAKTYKHVHHNLGKDHDFWAPNKATSQYVLASETATKQAASLGRSVSAIPVFIPRYRQPRWAFTARPPWSLGPEIRKRTLEGIKLPPQKKCPIVAIAYDNVDNGFGSNTQIQIVHSELLGE